MQVFGLGSIYSGYGVVADSCEQDNEISGSINGVNLFNGQAFVILVRWYLIEIQVSVSPQKIFYYCK